MNQMRITIIALPFIAAALCALPASRANETKPAAKNITFNKDIAPISFKSCSECHRPGENAPFSALSYKDVRPWAKSIREKVMNKDMPPWHADPQHGQFQNDRRLTQTEIDTITAWVDGGAKEGSPKDLPPAPKFVEGWGIGKPDLVLSMPEAYTVEAAGPDEYQYFEVPTGFTEDRYVQAVEARAGNRKVVHHLVVFVQPSAKAAAPLALSQSKPNFSGVNVDGAPRLPFTETWAKSTPQASKSASDIKAEQELTKLGNEFEEGLRRNDPSVFEKYFSPDWLYTTLEGQTSKARPALIAALKSGALKIEEWRTESPQWQIYGDTAVSTALTTFKGKNNGQEVNARFRATSTFVKRDGRWQVAATQHTPIVAAADKSKLEQEIQQFVADLVAAFERNDAAALDRLYADDFIGTTLAGELYDRPALLGVIKSGIQKYESVKVDEIKIHVYGETATVHSRGRIKLLINGQPKEDFTRDTTTLVKRQGQWRIVADHATAIARQ